jgi:hypothetical protein
MPQAIVKKAKKNYAMKFKMDKDYCFANLLLLKANFWLIFELPKHAIVLCMQQNE